MKKIILFISICLAVKAHSQIFPVGHMSINFKDASRTGGYSISGGITMPGSGRTIGAEVYYPATIAGTNTPVAPGAQYPVVVFGHGFAMGFSSYDNIYNRIASLGYIVLLPRTEGGTIAPPPVHLDFGKDLAFLAAQGMALNTVSTPTILTTFNGNVIQKSAIGGHSMGGGASYLGAATNTTLTCLFNFAAATTNNVPNSIAQASLVIIPTLVISGQKDNVADSTVQNSHYSGLASSKKFHVIIKDLTHCDVGNGTDVLCAFGQPACSTPSCNTIYFQRYMTYLEPFLANQLKNDCSEGQRFMDSINSTSSNRSGRKITGTLVCAPTSLLEQTNLKSFNVYPNPAQNVINISYRSTAGVPVQFEIYDMMGKLVYKQTEDSSLQSNQLTKELNISKLDLGTYILYINQKEFKGAYKIIKH